MSKTLKEWEQWAAAVDARIIALAFAIMCLGIGVILLQIGGKL
jgi:hypothetical protein